MRIIRRVPAVAARDGDHLTGEVSYRGDGKGPKKRTWHAHLFDMALQTWFSAADDGDTVDVIVGIGTSSEPELVQMTDPPVVPRPIPDPLRLELVDQHGGGLNPYSFIPTPPRDRLPEVFADREPAPYGVLDTADQWVGRLSLTLTLHTPMLLPDPQRATCDDEDHKTYPVQVDPNGRPLLHGASLKGALRSAYESVTGSRYGVFRDHDRALAYRAAPTTEKATTRRVSVTPARVEDDGAGGLRFRPCDAIPLPLYGDGRKATAVGAATQLDWGQLHGRQVQATVRSVKNNLKVVDRVALADDTSITLNGEVCTGWLSITGRSFPTKTKERLFCANTKSPIPVTDEHHRLWQAVLTSYQEAATLHQPPADTVRSRHVPGTESDAPSRLHAGDLVYLNRTGGVVTAVQPVMVGRVPYTHAPAELLDASLHPAATPAQMSAADRVFGWSAPEAGPGRPRSSGSRGRLRVVDVRCVTDDWLVEHAGGVALAPLSTPHPTQFRFYTAADSAGTRLTGQTTKAAGYQDGAALRGRKAYWYPAEPPDGYWTPTGDPLPEGHREYLSPPGVKASQTATHLGWVRPGTEFRVELFIDGIPGAELGPLIWLASQDGCALRLGGGKPLGFGATRVRIDWDRTELRTTDALRGCWLDLTRPDPSDPAAVQALGVDFDRIAEHDPVLAPAVAAWRRLAAGTTQPVHYPRTQPAPHAETYTWFVENERVTGDAPRYGLALPHVLEEDQRLPLLPPDSSDNNQDTSPAAKPKPQGPKSKPQGRSRRRGPQANRRPT